MFIYAVIANINFMYLYENNSTLFLSHSFFFTKIHSDVFAYKQNTLYNKHLSTFVDYILK